MSVKSRPISETIEQVSKWRSQGLRIVFTNGCFDILHPGHIACLKEARALGDKLIVGLNSDSSVKKLKGNDRPVFSLKDRIETLISLRYVDLVVPFSSETPLSLIKKIRPDILVKGGDYNEGNIVGSKYVLSTGGMVKSLKFAEGYSTTDLISRIKKLNRK